MNCPNCHQPIDPGAAFCGNCGHPLPPAVTQTSNPVAGQASPLAQNVALQPPPQPMTAVPQPIAAAPGLPAYAVATPAQHVGETKALLAIIFGILGLLGAIIPLIGIAFGVTGIIMGSLSRHSAKRTISTVGIVVSSLAIVASLGVLAYFIANPDLLETKKASTTNSHNLPSNSISASSLSTPCYSTTFSSKLNISNAQHSCDMAAFNGTTLETSSNFYKVYADKTSLTSDTGFTDIAKAAIEKDVQTNLPGFSVKSEKVSQFSGSAAYIVTAIDEADGIIVVEEAIYHPVSNGENVFILVHATTGNSANLNDLEAAWQWN